MSQMLRCKDIYARASDYQDRKLSFRERAAFWMHLRLCDGCRALLAQLAATKALLGKLRAGGLSGGEESELAELLRRAGGSGP